MTFKIFDPRDLARILRRVGCYSPIQHMRRMRQEAILIHESDWLILHPFAVQDAHLCGASYCMRRGWAVPS